MKGRTVCQIIYKDHYKKHKKEQENDQVSRRKGGVSRQVFEQKKREESSVGGKEFHQSKVLLCM